MIPHLVTGFASYKTSLIALVFGVSLIASGCASHQSEGLTRFNEGMGRVQQAPDDLSSLLNRIADESEESNSIYGTLLNVVMAGIAFTNPIGGMGPGMSALVAYNGMASFKPSSDQPISIVYQPKSSDYSGISATPVSALMQLQDAINQLDASDNPLAHQLLKRYADKLGSAREIAAMAPPKVDGVDDRSGNLINVMGFSPETDRSVTLAQEINTSSGL